MLKIKSLTMKNFLSVGNVTQSVNFMDNDLTLILGENLDLGGNDNRNGTGKTGLVNSLSYVLFGSALSSIKKDNLINATNMKNMLVTLTFEVNGVNYTIERGRKPNIFKFIKDGIEEETDNDESQGVGRNTQLEIERIIGFSHTMFKHIVALNTSVVPFLSLRAHEQREIIEQLLGITKLSEKAERLKEETRLVKDRIKEEEFRISAATEANKRIEANIIGLEGKSRKWDKDRKSRISSLEKSIEEMLNVDIDKEFASHKRKAEINDLNVEYRSLNKELKSLENDVVDADKAVTGLNKLLSKFSENICPTCNQTMDKKTHNKVHGEYVTNQQEAADRLAEKKAKRDDVKQLADSVKSVIPTTAPVTFYNTIEEAYNHKSMLDTLNNSLSAEVRSENPFVDQIETLRTDGLQEIDFAKMNELTRLKDHQEYLIKLLTNKDSFIRKRIIDQNLALLNNRMEHYLMEIGLPHAVKFMSDLEVEITMFGKEFDFDNLSRGERTRLILSLSWAFRDVYESMNDKVNLLFIDELCDTGLDTAGAECVLKVLKDMSRAGGKNIYLISHKDEFMSRISTVLKVVKEGGFSTFEQVSDVE